MQLGFSYNFILAAEPFTKALLLYLLVTAYVETFSSLESLTTFVEKFTVTSVLFLYSRF